MDGKSTANPAVAAGELRPEQHVEFLDYFRGAAILFVFVFHCLNATFGADQPGWNGQFHDFHLTPEFVKNLPPYFAQAAAAAHDIWLQFLALTPATIGMNGVAIFFVVSGFCIHLSYQRAKRHGFKEFFWRRFFRIYPVYFAALLLFCFVDTSTRLDFRSAHGVYQFLTHVFLVHNLFGPRYYWGINGVFWSIAVEVQLYVIYPLLLWIVKRMGWKGALWLTAIIELSLRGIWAIWNLDESQPWAWLFNLPFTWWFSWTLGAKIADDWLNHRPIFMAKWPLWFWPLVNVGFWFCKPLFDFNFTTAALATAAITAYLLTHKSVRLPVPRFVAEQVRLAGVMSYSIYLLHLPLLRRVPSLLGKILPNVHFPALAVYAFCLLFWFAILIPSWLFYRFGEVPSIEYGKAFVKRRRKTAHPAQSPGPRSGKAEG